MELETTKEEIRERFRLIGEIWMICWELADGDCRTDLDDFSIDSADMEDYLPDEDVEPEIDTGDTITGKCWFGGVSFDDSPMPMIDFAEEWESGRMAHCSLPAIYVPSKTLEVVRQLLERYVNELKASEQ